jgi:hypothetical protein
LSELLPFKKCRLNAGSVMVLLRFVRARLASAGGGGCCCSGREDLDRSWPAVLAEGASSSLSSK